MRVLIFHGYLLRGTGSNVYNAGLAAALARLGHEVHLACQERDPPLLAPPGVPGSVTIHNPDIGGLLPVFVYDTYEGFEVKTFSDLTEAELARYIDANVAAVAGLLTEVGTFDAVLANHLIMSPVILGRAGLRYALKVHGSDLSYTVLPNLERFRPYAEEACAGAAGILVGSDHIAERLRLAVDTPEVNAKVRLGPPGVDTTLFAPVAPTDRAARLRQLAADLRAIGGSTTSQVVDPQDAGEGSTWDREVAEAADAIEWFADAPGPRVVFVGKLIVSKGIDLLLAAWPLVHAANPSAQLLIVGFGGLESTLRAVWEGVERSDAGPLAALAARGRGLEAGADAGLPILTAFLSNLPPGYAESARSSTGSVAFAGRLEHEEVGELVPACDALVFPSTFPEAFGMVAAEAASAGVLPVSAAHSGAAEVSRELAAVLPGSARDLVSFPLDDNAVAAIADRLNRWLALDARTREQVGASLRLTVERLWSWEGVARDVLDAAN